MPYLETVQELLEAKEGEHVQFKEAKNRFDFGEAAKCCCALANNGGGKLVFGITDKRPRSVVGSAAFDQPERTRMGLIEKLKVNVDFQLFNYEEKRVLVFDVKSRPIGLPVQYDGVAWIYEGDTLKPMPEDMRRSIYEETGGDFSGTICAGATVDDLDETAIENFRAQGTAVKAHPPEQRSWYSVQRIAASFAGSQSQSDSRFDEGIEKGRKGFLRRKDKRCKVVCYKLMEVDLRKTCV